MMGNKSAGIMVVGLLVVAMSVVIKYAWRDTGEGRESSAAMMTSHLPGAVSKPSKENASKVFKEDIEHLRNVVRDDSSNSSVIFELARMLQDSHNSGEAVRYYALGLRVDPKNDSARIDYSLCLYGLGRASEARKQCAVVLHNDPANPQALFNIGAIYANSGAWDSARAYWGKLIMKHPAHELALRAQADLKTLEGESTSL